MQFDDTGKVALGHIYTQPDPRAYFTELRKLEYHIPQLAKPHFQQLIGRYRDERGVPDPQVLDIGCSYGINDALLGLDLTMTDLYDRYTGADNLTRAQVLARDRALVAERRRARAKFVGLDISEPAARYACEAGFLDDAVLADLENGEPTASQRKVLEGTDVMLSTGVLGYITETTIGKIVDVSDRPPWMAHFVLRMFPFEPIEQRLAEAGYRTERAAGMFRQRRFASADEQVKVLDTLSAVGVDPSGHETDGWFYAHLYLSRPAH